MATDWKSQGKRNRRKGGDWEREVRKELEEDGWVVVKFANNIDLDIFKDEVIGGKFIVAKPYFAGRMMMLGAGFPDFLCYKPSPTGQKNKIMFVECKINGKLNKQEKEKMVWLKSEGYACWVAGKDDHDCVEFCIPKKTMAMLKAEAGNE